MEDDLYVKIWIERRRIHNGKIIRKEHGTAVICQNELHDMKANDLIDTIIEESTNRFIGGSLG